MKTALRFLRQGVFGFVGAVLIFLIIAAVLSTLTAKPAEFSCGPETTSVYLQYSAVHVDIVLPVKDLSAKTRAVVSLPSDPDYLVFGLGDRDIYVNTPTWADLKARYAIKALFLPSANAIHLEPAFEVSDQWIKLELCEKQRQALEDYVMASFTLNSSAQTILIEGMTYTGHDSFYEAEGTYTMLNSCNNWANGALKSAGIRSSLWSPFSFGVIHHARKYQSRTTS